VLEQAALMRCLNGIACSVLMPPCPASARV